MNKHIKRDLIKSGLGLPKPPKIDKIDFILLNAISIFCVVAILVGLFKK